MARPNSLNWQEIDRYIKSLVAQASVTANSGEIASQISSQLSAYMKKIGGTFTGPVQVQDPTAPAHPVTLDYFESYALPAERGLAFSKTGAQEVTVTASMPLSSDAVVHVWDGTSWKARSFTGTKTINFATTGAGALLSGSVASSTGYYLFPISTSAGSVAWIASTSSSVSIGSLPSGYTEVGRWKWWVCTDGSSNIRAFKQSGPIFTYAANKGIYVLGSDRGTGGLATTPTMVDATGLLPEGARLVWCPWTAMNNGGAKTLTIYSGSGLELFDRIPSNAAANSAYSWGGDPWDYEGDPSEFCQYSWSGTPGAAGGEQGLNLPIRNIFLHETIGAVV